MNKKYISLTKEKASKFLIEAGYGHHNVVFSINRIGDIDYTLLQDSDGLFTLYNGIGNIATIFDPESGFSTRFDEMQSLPSYLMLIQAMDMLSHINSKHVFIDGNHVCVFNEETVDDLIEQIINYATREDHAAVVTVTDHLSFVITFRGNGFQVSGNDKTLNLENTAAVKRWLRSELITWQ